MHALPNEIPQDRLASGSNWHELTPANEIPHDLANVIPQDRLQMKLHRIRVANEIAQNLVNAMKRWSCK
jgi:hypothetical protein